MGKAPDGTPILMHKVGDHWVLTDERLQETEEKAAQEDVEFMSRFKDTDMVPHPVQPGDKTDAVTVDVQKMVEHHGHTYTTLDAHLGEILGDPKDIISGKIKPKKVNDPAILRNVDMMIRALRSPAWNKVWEIMTK